MNPFGQMQDPLQAPPRDPNPAQACAPYAARVPAQPPPCAKPGFRGLWANPMKCDTSNWNRYYYYFRQIAQHGIWKLKNLKWICLVIDIYFLLNVILLPVIYYKGKLPGLLNGEEKAIAYVLMGIALHPLVVLALALSLIPTIMIGQSFKLRTRNYGFLTSRAKEQPLIHHLLEYTSGKDLIMGVIQSQVYTLSRLILFLSPAVLISAVSCAVLVWKYPAAFDPSMIPPFAKVLLAVLTGILAVMNFLTMQGFSFRVDTLCFAILLAAEMIVYFPIGNPFAWNDREFFFFLLMWGTCMVYYPLAAADTIECGIGKYARAIRLFLLGIILVNFLVLFVRVHRLEPSLWVISRTAVMPSLWIMAGVIGLLVSSLSAASYRAKHLFRLHASTAKNTLAVRLFDPASPFSVLPVFVLEIIIVTVFTAITKAPDSVSIMSSSNDFSRGAVLLALWVWTSLHFALTLILFIRRHSHKERKPWLAHPNFNGAFFLILAILGVSWLLLGRSIVFLCLFFFLAGISILTTWEPVNVQEGFRPGKKLSGDFGRDQR